jgi:hypothetical protein
MPNADSTLDLGLTGLRWSNIYADKHWATSTTTQIPPGPVSIGWSSINGFTLDVYDPGGGQVTRLANLVDGDSFLQMVDGPGAQSVTLQKNTTVAQKLTAQGTLDVTGLTTLTSDLLVNGGNIGITGDTDLMKLTNGRLEIDDDIKISTSSIKSDAGLIDFDNENLRTTGWLSLSDETPSTNAHLSDKLASVTPSNPGIWELADTASVRIPTRFGQTIQLNPLVTENSSAFVGGTSIVIQPNGVGTPGGPNAIAGLFGGVNGTMTAAGAGGTLPEYIGLKFEATNDGNLVGGSKTGFYRCTGADLSALLGSPNDTISAWMETQAVGVCATATMDGNYNSTSTNDGFNAGIEARTLNALEDVANGTNINSYGVYVDAVGSSTESSGGTVTGYGLYNANDVMNILHGEVYIGSLTDPTEPLQVGDGTNETNIGDDGDLFFEGTAGLQFAQIYEEDGSSTLALPAQDTFYQITAFTANGESNGMTPDHTNDHITVAKSGMYLAFLDVSFSQTTAVSIEYDFHVQKNNGTTDFPYVSAHRDTAGGNTVGATNGTGIIDLDVNDTVEVWVERLTGGAVSRTITIPQVSLTLTQVGGT